MFQDLEFYSTAQAFTIELYCFLEGGDFSAGIERVTCWVEDGFVQHRDSEIVFRKGTRGLPTFFEANSLFLFLAASPTLVNNYNSQFRAVSHVNPDSSFKFLAMDDCVGLSWGYCLGFSSSLCHPMSL